MKVEIVNLSKIYGGGIRALEQINLDLRNGMFGLLGPNGAGKTTLMRIIATLLPPTQGEVLIDGLSVHKQPTEIRHLLVVCWLSFAINSKRANGSLGVISSLVSTP